MSNNKHPFKFVDLNKLSDKNNTKIDKKILDYVSLGQKHKDQIWNAKHNDFLENKENYHKVIKDTAKKQTEVGIKIQDFQIGQFLGKGSFGTVKVARHRQTGTFYCVKTLKRQKIQKNLDAFIRSLKIQMFLDHPNIVKVYGVIVQKKQVYVIMELCIDGDLSQNVKDYTKHKNDGISIIRGITQGIYYLHDNNIMHRDLKLENIVINYGFPKITDFDLSVVLSLKTSQSRTTVCGSPAYFSPEMINNSPYTFKADIWALGIIFYEILCGYFPFKFDNMVDVHSLIQKNMEKLPKKLDQLAKNLIYRMLQKKQKQRIDIYEIIKHPYILKGSKNTKKIL